VGGSCDDVYYDAERKRILCARRRRIHQAWSQQNDPDHYTLSCKYPFCRGRAHGHFLWNESVRRRAGPSGTGTRANLETMQYPK